MGLDRATLMELRPERPWLRVIIDGDDPNSQDEEETGGARRACSKQP
jgi:hypothetical protein